GDAIEVLYAVREPFVVDQQARDYGVIDDLEPLGFECGLDQVIRRIEERSDVAAAPALTAEVALGMSVVIARHDGAAPGDDRNPNGFGRFLHQALAAAWSWRGHVELTPRQGILIVCAARNADELIDVVVVRRDVLVANRPWDFPAVLRRTFEVEVGV